MVETYIQDSIREKQTQIEILIKEIALLQKQYEASKNKTGIEKWLNHRFESSSALTPEFSNFAKDFKKELKRQLPDECEIVAWSRGHFYVSCFIKNKETSKFAYLSHSDVRFFPDEWYNNILIRTAKHEKDYTGGSNCNCKFPELKEWIERLTFQRI